MIVVFAAVNAQSRCRPNLSTYTFTRGGNYGKRFTASAPPCRTRMSKAVPGQPLSCGECPMRPCSSLSPVPHCLRRSRRETSSMSLGMPPRRSGWSWMGRSMWDAVRRCQRPFRLQKSILSAHRRHCDCDRASLQGRIELTFVSGLPYCTKSTRAAHRMIWKICCPLQSEWPKPSLTELRPQPCSSHTL